MKKLLITSVIISVLCFCIFFTSCEFGGTIVVKNNYSEDISVTAYSEFKDNGFLFEYRESYGPINIISHSTGSFDVNSDTKYGIVWSNGKIKDYKTVHVSNGETIYVDIP